MAELIGASRSSFAEAFTRILGESRSEKAIAKALAASAAEILSGRLTLRQTAVADLVLEPGEARFDIAVAIRVGALDGRHPDGTERALKRIEIAVLTPAARCPGRCRFSTAAMRWLR